LRKQRRRPCDLKRAIFQKDFISNSNAKKFEKIQIIIPKIQINSNFKNYHNSNKKVEIKLKTLV